MSDAVLIAAHGSRDDSGIDEFYAFVDAWRALRPDRPLAAGFLEFVRPTIGEAVDNLVASGAQRITVVPAMLLAAGHVKNDVPSELAEVRTRHANILIRMARPLDLHPALLELCGIRYREAIAPLQTVDPARTLLLVVGRGTSDPDANANVARISRFLWESYKVSWASIAFAGLARPSVDEALAVCSRIGFDRIVLQPYFLFDGVLVKRIRDAAERQAAVDPNVEVVSASHLRAHPLLVQAFEERVHESIHGEPHMNCDVCKYRVRLIGRELDLGSPQVGHHFNSRAAIDEGVRHDHGLPRRPRRGAVTEAKIDVDEPFAGTDHTWDERLLSQL